MEQDCAEADLLLVIGSSLQVMPFAGILGAVSPLCPRVLINREQAGMHNQKDPPMFFGNIGFRFGRKDNYRDLFVGGNADDTIGKLSKALKWSGALKSLQSNYSATNPWDQLVAEQPVDGSGKGGGVPVEVAAIGRALFVALTAAPPPAQPQRKGSIIVTNVEEFPPAKQGSSADSGDSAGVGAEACASEGSTVLTDALYKSARQTREGKWMPSFYSIAPGFEAVALSEPEWDSVVAYTWEAMQQNPTELSAVLKAHLHAVRKTK
jgi:hypothetical protein